MSKMCVVKCSTGKHSNHRLHIRDVAINDNPSLRVETNNTHQIPLTTNVRTCDVQNTVNVVHDALSTLNTCSKIEI